MYHHGILELNLTPASKEPLANLSLILLDECNIAIFLSCDNGDFAPQPASLVASTVDPISGPPTAPSLSWQLGSIQQKLPTRHCCLPLTLALDVTVPLPSLFLLPAARIP